MQVLMEKRRLKQEVKPCCNDDLLVVLAPLMSFESENGENNEYQVLRICIA